MPATPIPTTKVRDAHRQAVGRFLESHLGPFRRQQVADVLFARISPRSRPVADKLAQAVMTELARSGAIVRHGHLHWVSASRQRTLRNGRMVPELSDLAALQLETRCPQKWAAVDMETGEVWMGSPKGWTRGTKAQLTEVRSCISGISE